MRRAIGVGLLGAAAAAFGAYTYYYSDSFTSIDATKWTQNGTFSAPVPGLTSATANGASLISSVAVPDGTSDYEVKTTLTLTAPGGGTYVTYLHSSADGLSGPGGHGTYYAIELQNPTFTGSTCTATLAGYRSVAGVVTALASTSVPCHSGMVLRTVYRGGGSQIAVYIDNAFYYWASDSTIASGQPGVGVRGAANAGNFISQVQLGPLDRVAPNAIPAGSIGTSSFPARVDMQWANAGDDANGSGVSFYQVYRNGSYLNTVIPQEFSDQAVVAGTQYSYALLVFDYHLNSTTTNIAVATAPAGAVDPRRVGVRSTGAYYGGMGENMDLLSGNLNFTMPLLKALGRGGWSVAFNLSYNSENWRQDSGGVWNLGRDVGYGYGWKLQAGSLTGYYTGYWTLDHYVFTDATGAEYRLDQNIGGVWTSKDSIYVSYDSNAGRLYFNNGSFWVLGCTSAGTEQDAGTMYPTLMQDSNGNQIAIRYNAGLNVAWSNSSARIYQIEGKRLRNPS